MNKTLTLLAFCLLLSSCGASPEMKTIPLEGSQTEARVSAFTDDGEFIAIGYGKRISPTPGKPNFTDSRVKIYSSKSQKEVSELIKEEHGIPHSLKFSRDNSKLLVGYDKGAVLWDIIENEPLFTFLPRAHTGFDNPPPMEVTLCDFSPDEERVLLAGGIQIYIYDTKRGKEVTSFKTPWIKSARYLAEGKICSGHAGVANDIRIYDITSASLLQSFKCRGEVKSLHLNNQNDYLWVSAFNSNDPYAVDIYVWDLAKAPPQHPAFSLNSHKDNINAVVFMPSAGFIVSSSYDRTTKFWDISSGKIASTQRFKKVLAGNGASLIAENFKPYLLNLE